MNSSYQTPTKYTTFSHSFSVDLAKKYGITEALLIQYFQFWINKNRAFGKNFKEGRTWMYQSIKEMAVNFPYLSESQLKDLLEKMATGKNRKAKYKVYEPVIIKGNFNNNSYDNTSWYAFVDEETFLSAEHPKDFIKPEETESAKTLPEPKQFALEDIPQTPDGTSHKHRMGHPTVITVIESVIEKDKSVMCTPPPQRGVNGGYIEKKEREMGIYKKKSFDGKYLEVNESDIYRMALRKHPDWTVSEIQEALDILLKYQGCISSIERFVEGTVKKIRTLKNFEKMEKYECKMNKKYKNILPKEESKLEEKPLPTIADLAIAKRLFPDSN